MPARPTFQEAFRFWLKLGFVSFGGPTGQIAIMHTELVERRKWIGEQRFMHALNYCMLLPGPEATQLATYCGWLLHGTWGGLVAGILFVLPAAVLLWALSWVYVAHGSLPWVAAIFYGLKPAVTAIVAAAMVRIGRRALRNRTLWAVAGLAFAALYFGRVPFPAIVASAALFGFFAGRRWPEIFDGSGPGAAPEEAIAAPPVASPWRHAAQVLAVGLVLWSSPVIAAGVWQGWDGVLVREGIFFSQAAMVTFGGAYAVLPYVGQQAVEHYGWLTATQMVDGLGLAETTPGPLIMVVQFVGFLGGWNQPGPLSPLGMATLGAATTTWTTFVPCFLWIFLGAPHIERLRGNRRLNAALTVVTAAVVGVILNLALWFAVQVFFPHGADGGIAGADWFAVAVSVGALAALLRFKTEVVWVVLTSAALGLIWKI